MEVLTNLSAAQGPVLLPNAEVMEMLQKSVKQNKKRFARVKANHRKKNYKTQQHNDAPGVVEIKNTYAQRDWIESKVLEYLQGTPCVQIPVSKIPELKSKCMGSKRQHRSHRQSSDADDNNKNPTVSGYGLTEAETLQVLNLMPQEPVEIHFIVEEVRARMSESQEGEFLSMIKSYRKDSSGDNDDKENDDGGDKGDDDGDDDEEPAPTVVVKQEI
jgi:hypothetical protein